MIESEILRKAISEADNLPVLPAIYEKIASMTLNPSTTAKDLAQVISDDIALTSKLLKLVNSPFYAFPRRITTIPQAIVILGYSALRNLVLTKSAFELFPKFVGTENFKYFLFWKHSVACGVGSKVISKMLKFKEIEEMFVSGLLHDVGKIIQEQFAREEFSTALQLAADKGITILEAESKVMGYTHTETGNLVAEKWNLPDVIVESITYHHKPKHADKHRLEVSIVHLANVLAHALEFGSSGQKVLSGVDPAAWEMIGLKLSAVELIMTEMLNEFGDAVSFIMS